MPEESPEWGKGRFPITYCEGNSEPGSKSEVVYPKQNLHSQFQSWGVSCQRWNGLWNNKQGADSASGCSERHYSCPQHAVLMFTPACPWRSESEATEASRAQTLGRVGRHPSSGSRKPPRPLTGLTLVCRCLLVGQHQKQKITPNVWKDASLHGEWDYGEDNAP